MKKALIALSILLMTSCGVIRYQATYDFEIAESISKADKAKTSGLGFEDEYINAAFMVNNDDISINIMNKTEKSMKMLWDDCAIITDQGRSLRVIHEGVLYANRDAPQAPTLIPGNGFIRDSVMPANNIYMSQGYSYYRKLLPMPVSAPADLENEFRTQVQKQSGSKPLSFIMALEIEGVKHEYRFVFKVIGSTITQEKTIL